MKQSREVIAQRQSQLLDFIKSHSGYSVENISQELGLSISTLRRDLTALQHKGYINRNQGIITLSQGNSNSYTIAKIKNDIAKETAKYIKDRDTVFINTSSTALTVLSYLPNERITVFTNNANAINTQHNPNIQVILTGGELRIPKYSMVGDIALSTISKIRANKVILGCNGISATNGVTTNNLIEVAINEKMVNNCTGEVFVVAHHSKIGRDGNFLSVKISRVDYLITDNQADPEQLELLKKAGVKIILVDSLGDM